ncbi:hypothetical protein GGC65_000389 [Sphingopyxis sp. OAS728]|jgi:hypothetical protein|nr:hypothetical protein [Sphingopyxis sp. OAS728]MBE1525933.1 hypothetical protein [Sphingopyxis sp. OAS728]
MLAKLLEMLGLVIDAGSGVPANRRERIGCIMGLAVIVPVAIILLLISFI